MQLKTSGDIKKRSVMMWRIQRHFTFIFKHLTLKKIFNAVLCLFEMKMKRSFLYSHPLYLRVEVCPYCNLSCAGCTIGGVKDIVESSPDHRKQGIMKYDSFVESIRDFVPTLFKVNLYDEGEPLLNKEIYKMVKYLSQNNVSTCVSTNFSFKISEATLEEMLNSGLEHLIVALDGATPESYSRYRKGGDFQLVISNIKRLVSRLKEKKKNPLKIEIQFLEFEDNQEERQKLQQLAQDLGVWRFTILQGYSREGWTGIRFKGTEGERRERGCYDIWISTTINSAGEVGTCDYGEDHGIPNIGFAKDYMSKGLRNHPSLIQLRKSFRDKIVSLNEICCHCSQYQK